MQAAYAPPTPFRRWGALYPAALLTAGAGVIHLLVAPSHYEVDGRFGVLFYLLGAAQLFLAAELIRKPGRRVASVAAALALGVIAVWALSRTIGLPIGPDERVQLFGSDGPGLFLQLVTADDQVPGIATSALELLSLPFLLIVATAGPYRTHRTWWWIGSAAPATLLATLITAVGATASVASVPYEIDMSAPSTGAMSIPMSSLVERPGNEPVRSFTLRAQVTKVDGEDRWTYNGQLPGPELRVHVGDRVRVRLENRLPASTSIHWHGLRLPNAEDGVAGVTQDAVPTGANYTYEFIAKDPGTFWYHSHQQPQRQVPLGLYGALVVLPEPAPHTSVDQTVIKGDANPSEPVKIAAHPGERVHLRLVSAFQEDVPGIPERVVVAGARYTVTSMDGHDLNAPQELDARQLLIGPGQRFDVEFTQPADSAVAIFDERERSGNRVIAPLWAIVGEGPMPARVPAPPVFDLTRYGSPAPDAVFDKTAFDVRTDLTITATPGLRHGALQFQQLFNGKTFPETPTIVVREGQFVLLHLENDTEEFHPIHLHGHFMTVLTKDGVRTSGSPVHLDSVLLGPKETWEVGFLADNPGLWMLHCHVLIHANYGLSAMVSYAGVTTPFTIGTKSGNLPE